MARGPIRKARRMLVGRGIACYPMIEISDGMTDAAIRAFWTALADGGDVQTAMRAAIAAALDAIP